MVSFNAACILMRRSSRSSRSGAVRGISGPLPLEALGLRAAFGVTRASHSTTRNMCCPSLACGSSVRCSSALCCSAEARVCGFYAAACEYRATDGQNTRVAGGSEVSKDPPTFSYSMTTAGAGLRLARGPRVTLARRRPTRREGAALAALRSVRRRPRTRRGGRAGLGPAQRGFGRRLSWERRTY